MNLLERAGSLQLAVEFETAYRRYPYKATLSEEANPDDAIIKKAPLRKSCLTKLRAA